MDRPNIQIRKILRSPSVKRKNKTVPVSERVALEKVLGLTVSNNAALATDPASGTVAYPAGCVIVLYNPKKGKQTHIFNASKKTITCLAFSGDGKHIVSGETGHQPAVRVWDLEERTQVAEFFTHKYGVACVAFSPNLKYILSVGSEHDMLVCVWNWKLGLKVASNKVASKVSDVAFSQDGSMFVTVGNRHVKFWYLDASKSKIKTETVPLMGRNGILGEHQNNFFCGVCCGKGDRANTVFAITESGLLCEFNDKRLLSKWVLLRTDCANAITASDRYIFVGCANGLVRIFSAATLNFVSTLPAPHHLGVDVASGVSPSNVGAVPKNARYPDTLAIRYSDCDSRLTCVYNDHSVYIWDVTDIRKVGKTRSFLFHSGAIWGIDAYPCDIEDRCRSLPVGSFVTCSSDNTIRVWNCDPHISSEGSLFKRNIYSNELLKVLYLDPELTNLQDIAYNPAGKKDKTDTAFQEKCGIRCVRLDPNGLHLASGDRAGNVRVHELQSMQQIAFLEAHDSEVLCLEFSRPCTGVQLLATASRDRLLHVFDINHNYGLVQTLDDHSSAITAIRFSEVEGQLMMLSCGVDKSLLFRNVQLEPDFRFVLNRHMVSRTTLYDMEVDLTGKFVATACQDRNIRIYNTRNGKQKKCYNGSSSGDGTLLRLELDPSSNYVGTSSSDKSLSIYDFFSGECVATMYGHSEISTGIKFLDDLKHFVSVSVDGCIFVWRLPSELTEHIRDRLSNVHTLPSSVADDNNVRRETFVVTSKKNVLDSNDNFHSPGPPPVKVDSTPDSASPPNLDYRFSVGQLPSWAKRQVLQENYVKTPSGQLSTSSVLPKGRWATRFDDQGVVVRSVLDTSSLQDMKFVNEDATSSVSSCSDVKSKVSFITDDDETNRDDDLDDEFKAAEKAQDALDAASHNIADEADDKQRLSEPVTLSRLSSVSADDDEDSVDSKETVYYLPPKDGDVDPNFDSAFEVYEGAVGKLSGPDATEDEDEDGVKSPSTPSDSNRDMMSDMSSVDDDKSQQDHFDEHLSTEKFDCSLKRLEEEAIDLTADSSSGHPGSRQSISALFLSKSLAPSQSRTLFKCPAQPPDKSKDVGVKTSKTVVEPRELQGPQCREKSASSAQNTDGRKIVRMKSIEGKPSSITFLEPPVQERRKWGGLKVEVSSPPRKWKSMFDVTAGRSSASTAPSILSPTKPGRAKTPTLSLSGKTAANRRSSSPSPLRYVTNNELKLDQPPGSSSTLPRASRNKARQSLANDNPSSVDSGGESSNKRRSAAHSYRMQTESSMAKVNANKEQNFDVKKKESFVTMRFQSTPNLPEDVKNESIMDSDKTLVASTDDEDLFGSSAWTVDVRQGRYSDGGLLNKDLHRAKTADDGGFNLRMMGSKESCSKAASTRPADTDDSNLMPPPLNIPPAVQASFISKANKHRRTTMPETLSQARDTGNGVKSNSMTCELSSSAPTGEDGLLTLTRVSVPLPNSANRNLLASPLEPPERDNSTLRGQTDTRLGLGFTSRSVSDVDKFGPEMTKAGEPAELTSPRVVKIGRCTSPVKPYVAKPSFVTETGSDVRQQTAPSTSPGLTPRRQLPANPKPGEVSRSADSSADRQSLSALNNSSLSADSQQRVRYTDSFTISVLQETDVNSSNLSRSGYGTWPSPGNVAVTRCSNVDVSNPSTSTPTHNASQDPADATQTWMKRAQQMQHQWEQRQQQQPVMSQSLKKEVPLSPQFIANSERSKTETRITTSSQNAIIHEIERYCEERRRSKEQVAERPDQLALAQRPEPRALVNMNNARRNSDELPSDTQNTGAAIDAQQQWEKAKQFKMFPSRASVSYTRSQSSGSSLQDSDNASPFGASSLSRHSVSSSASSTGSADDMTPRAEALPSYLTTPRYSSVPRPSSSPSDAIMSSHVRRSRPWSRSGLNSETSQPNEGEPDSTGSSVVSEPVLPTMKQSDETPSVSSSSSHSAPYVENKASSLPGENTYATEEQCSKLASDLSQAVVRATDLYTQLSDVHDSSKQTCQSIPNERALRLLHESLTDASLMLSKSLGIGKSSSDGAQMNSDATTRMMESMLERYSQQLSSQVYELFKQKLDELQTATKL